MKELKPRDSDQKPMQKQPYEPPKAIFVPLKMQERLLGCDIITYRGESCGVPLASN